LTLLSSNFWNDDELAHRENCFSTELSQVALGIRMNDECVFAKLGVKVGRLNLTECNFGLDILVDEIRKYCRQPGLTARFTFMNNDEEVKKIYIVHIPLLLPLSESFHLNFLKPPVQLLYYLH
jgi:hypothetical protein